MTRWIAPGGVLLGSLLLCGCSAVRTPEAGCRPLEVTEFPLFGFMWGAWMDDERFVLTDHNQSRLLVYDTSKGRVRIVNGWESPSPDLNFSFSTDIQPWRGGFVIADAGLRGPYRLLEMDASLRPVRVLWESDVERVDDRWVGAESTNIRDLLTLGDRLYLVADRYEDSGQAERLYAEFGPVRHPGRRSGDLGEQAAWSSFGGRDSYQRHPPLLHQLAATTGRDASVFALVYSESPFIQKLRPAERRLAAFPALPAPLPELPPFRGPQEAPAFYSVLEASSYPAGLYADEDSLYILMRNMTGDEPVWDLYRLDPQNDEIVSKVRLPTTAVHVSLLPGSRYWVLEESSSGVENISRPPIRLLLLDAAAIRAGGSLSCD